MKNRKVPAIIAAAVLAVSTLGLATSSQASPASDHRGQASPGVAAKADNPRVYRCDGGRNVNMRSRIVNVPFTFGETGTNAEDIAVPGAAMVVAGPRRGRDTLLITFSAEAQLGGSTDDLSDWMGLEVHLDGTPIQPYTAVGDVVAFTSQPDYNAHSLQFCTKIGRGKHKLQVFTNLFDGGDNDSLRGWLDDYLLSVVRYN
ncbi:hypothetical protein [Nocardioides sp.]|uniref:hypothetical protein n=1 Tax=Nocardioides sp. TaxID=35761 RepID=UPI003562018C